MGGPGPALARPVFCRDGDDGALVRKHFLSGVTHCADVGKPSCSL